MVLHVIIAKIVTIERSSNVHVVSMGGAIVCVRGIMGVYGGIVGMGVGDMCVGGCVVVFLFFCLICCF